MVGIGVLMSEDFVSCLGNGVSERDVYLDALPWRSRFVELVDVAGQMGALVHEICDDQIVFAWDVADAVGAVPDGDGVRVVGVVRFASKNER